jgi:hypothetical protein
LLPQTKDPDLEDKIFADIDFGEAKSFITGKFP